MRLQRLRLELRMELATNKMRMPRNLYHLDISAVRSRSRNFQAAGNHRLFVFAIEFVAMPVPLTNFCLAVNPKRQSVRLDLARPRAQTHRPTQLFHAPQLAQFVDHAMWRGRIKLAGIGLRQPADVARKLDASRLHAKTNAKVRHLLLARVLNCRQHPFDTALPESPRNQDSVVAIELYFIALV